MIARVQLLLVMVLMHFAAFAQAPPGFVVTSPNTAISWQGATNHTISWNVAGTEETVPYVDILLSTDGGATFTENLALKVPNDGAEVVLLPNTTGTENRIKVRKHDDDTFFDVSNANFTITDAGATFLVGFDENRIIEACRNQSSEIIISFENLNGFTDETTLSIADNYILQSTNINYINLNSNPEFTFIFTVDPNVNIDCIYPVTLIATSGSVVKTITIYIKPMGLGYLNISNGYPIEYPNQLPDVVSPNPTFSWSMQSYELYSEEIIFEVQIYTSNNTIIHTGTTIYKRIHQI